MTMMMQVSLHTPRKLPRQTRSLALVDAIVEAAARLLVREGRDALTTNAVAELAGVSIGSLYQYFPNREAVIAAVAARHARALQARMAEVDLARETTLAGALARIVAATFDAHRLAPVLHAALGSDLDGPGGVLPGGVRPAIVTAILALPPGLRGEIARPGARAAASIAAEIVHALANAAPTDAAMHDLEGEATVAALAYLRAEEAAL